MSQVESNRLVVAARREACSASSSVQHTGRVRLADGAEIAADDLADLIDAGRQYFMEAPKGTLLVDSAGEPVEGPVPPFVLQTRQCPACGRRVVFA